MRRPQTADTRLDAEWIIPVEPDGVVLERHSLIMADGRIKDVLPTSDADHLYQTRERYRLPGHALIPGLVNLHTHAAMALLRGYADDLPLMTWLEDHIWPTENRWLSPEFVHDGTRLACVEMLKGGTTCFNDMYFFPEAAVEAALHAKQRIAAGIIVVDFPTAYAADPDGYLQKGMALRDALRHHPLLSFCLAPHAPYSTGDKTLEKVVTFAAQLDLPVHMHVHETHDEIQQGEDNHGCRPLARLQHLGLLGPGFIAVHAVHLEPDEIDLLATHGCNIAHCPSSNLKLASGIAPVQTLLRKAINLGLGSDGAASNNRLDMWEEMRLAALLAKGVSGHADSLPAHTALRLATLNGARALGLESSVGSLVAGKQADVVAVDLSAAYTQPCFDPISQLIYSASRHEVRHVWVNGTRVVENGRCLSVDEGEVLHKAHAWRAKILGH
jgi:5-methylthioadenosine/S-adenosylhomocysteine deaminase